MAERRRALAAECLKTSTGAFVKPTYEGSCVLPSSSPNAHHRRPTVAQRSLRVVSRHLRASLLIQMPRSRGKRHIRGTPHQRFRRACHDPHNQPGSPRSWRWSQLHRHMHLHHQPYFQPFTVREALVTEGAQRLRSKAASLTLAFTSI